MSNNNYKGKISTFVIPPSNPWSCRFPPKATQNNDSYAGPMFQNCRLRWFWEKDGWNSQHKGARLYPFPNLLNLLPCKSSNYQGNRASFWCMQLCLSEGMQGIMLVRTQVRGSGFTNPVCLDHVHPAEVQWHVCQNMLLCNTAEPGCYSRGPKKSLRKMMASFHWRSYRQSCPLQEGPENTCCHCS